MSNKEGPVEISGNILILDGRVYELVAPKKRLRNKRPKELKAWAVEYKGGRCEDCKQSYPNCVYDFHHLDPKEKDFIISRAGNRTREEIKHELDKCALLCSNCHRIRHSK